MNCLYCGKKILKTSKEHVIQNALGGHLESEDICCPTLVFTRLKLER